MGTRRVTQVDTETGEELGSFVAVVKPKQKSPFERHFSMNQEALITMAKTLKPEEMRVLFVLLSELDYENSIQLQQTTIAKMLDMQASHVSRAIKGLVEKTVIEEGSKIGRNKSYRLNPNYGWKGTIGNHKKSLKNGWAIINGGQPVTA